ncbi:MAG TPA: hypothetical protein VM943_03720 [Pyrinomonadaceae bacterium]|nr:hypothetical protein [Pyrinomonadaceae bacterium]
MAEERNVGLARATDTPEADDEATKAELQRRMEEARESITQTVTEIKDTVTNQYQQVRESISDTLDWREQFRRRPVEFSLGALGVGLLVGYGVGGAFAGNRDGDDYEYEYDDHDTDPVSGEVVSSASRSYAAQPILGGPYGSPNAERNVSSPAMSARAMGIDESPAPSSRPSYSSGYEAPTSDYADENKPSYYSRFKETKAYDRLQSELSSLGDRFVDELSTTARSVVLPALLGKVKDMIGIDLSTQREVAQRSKLEHQTADARANAEASSDDAKTGGK